MERLEDLDIEELKKLKLKCFICKKNNPFIDEEDTSLIIDGETYCGKCAIKKIEQNDTP